MEADQRTALNRRRKLGLTTWCADFKGEFKLGNDRYCYPLTVTDHPSRFLLCEALDSTRDVLTKPSR